MPLIPCIFTIFGITSDLSRKKLLPALFRIWKKKDKHSIKIVGFGRRDFDEADFFELISQSITVAIPSVTAEELLLFSKNCSYFKGNFDDRNSFIRLVSHIRDIELDKPALRIFHLAMAPNYFGPVSQSLHDAALHESRYNELPRLIIEKPFGHDLASAKALDEQLLASFKEDQIYRIDHYLGKDAVQNILAFRFASGIFEPVWNSNYIDHIQITAAESDGIGSRAHYYDKIGALRDMVQNHCLQLLAHITMEMPPDSSANTLRDKRAEALASYHYNTLVTGQYTGYRDEPNIPAETVTETFGALKLFVHTDRWNNLPVYIRTGKRLPEKRTEISVHFKKPVQHLFSAIDANILTFRIQPDSAISILFPVKQPGTFRELTSQNLTYCYHPGNDNDAYEQLLLDCMQGDQTLFIRHDEVEASWQFMAPIIRELEQHFAPKTYAPSSWGPDSADSMIRNDDRQWKVSDN